MDAASASSAAGAAAPAAAPAAAAADVPATTRARDVQELRLLREEEEEV